MNSATGGLSCRTRVVFNVGPPALLRMRSAISSDAWIVAPRGV